MCKIKPQQLSKNTFLNYGSLTALSKTGADVIRSNVIQPIVNCITENIKARHRFPLQRVQVVKYISNTPHLTSHTC